MPVIQYVTNPLDELDGLKDGITLAVAGAITRTPNVINRQWTGFYNGPWPRISISDFVYHAYRIAGGNPPLIGNDETKPSQYLVELQDVVSFANGVPVSDTAVADSQTDLLKLFVAIQNWFDHKPNRCLPDQYGNARAKYTGIPLQMRSTPPFKESQGGDITVYKAFIVGVVGLPRRGSST